MKIYGFNAPNQYGFGSDQGFGFNQVGSTALALIIYSVNDIFAYTQDGSGNMVIDNKGSGSSTYDGLLNTGRGIELLVDNTFTITANYITWFDVTTASHQTTTTSKTFASETVNSLLASTNVVNASDLAILDANPNLLAKLGASTGVHSISELNVALTASDAYYACSEPSLATLYDARSAGTVTISNYAETVRTNSDYLDIGLQSTCVTLDANGNATAYREDALEFHSVGYADTQFNPSLESAFWIEEVIDGVIYQHHYDGTNLTTYTNNVAGTPTAHSPENADYLLGKGVYPKVTADPETTYTQEYLQVIVQTLAELNAFIAANYSVLTDGNGTPLTDANGVYLYE